MIRKSGKNDSSSSAFTIVELLIVIVVIGILAAITIVAYNGIQNRAKASGLQQTLAASARLVENARSTSTTSSYPIDQAAAQAAGMNSSITYYNGPGLDGFCMSKTDGTLTYMVTSNNKTPHVGPACSATNLTNLVANPSFEAGITSWAAASNITAFTRSSTAATGTNSLIVARANATAGNGYVSVPMTTVPGQQYQVSFAVRQSAGSPVLSATVRNTSATGAIPADAPSLTITPTASFTRYMFDWTAEATTTHLVIDTNAATSTYLLDSVLATLGDNAGFYVDPTTNTSWAWTGTAHASTSTGPAF